MTNPVEPTEDTRGDLESSELHEQSDVIKSLPIVPANETPFGYWKRCWKAQTNKYTFPNGETVSLDDERLQEYFDRYLSKLVLPNNHTWGSDLRLDDPEATTTDTVTSQSAPVENNTQLDEILKNVEDWHGYRDEALTNLPEDTRKFVDDASWAGELLKEERLKIAKAKLVAWNKAQVDKAVVEAQRKLMTEIRAEAYRHARFELRAAPRGVIIDPNQIKWQEFERFYMAIVGVPDLTLQNEQDRNKETQG